MTIKYINGVEDAPKAIGPYSQATNFGNLFFLSGQIPINPATAQIEASSIEDQAEQVLKNISAVLSFNKLSFANIVKTTIFLTDLGTFKSVNAIYEKWLGEFKPARSTIQVAALPLGAQIEIEMIACK